MVVTFFVAFASCLMLCAAQLHFQPQQMAALQSLQPVQVPSLPDSHTFMAQAAHNILRQGPGSPLQPGILGGLPVLVNDAAQSVLDQESKIVGYNMSPELAAVLQQQQAQALALAQGQSQEQLFQHHLPQQIQMLPQLQTQRHHPQPQQIQIPGKQESQEQPQLQQAQLVAETPSVQQAQFHRPTGQQVHHQILIPQQQQQENSASPAQQILYHVQQAMEGIEEENENQQVRTNQEERVQSITPPPQYRFLNQQQQVSTGEEISQNVIIRPQPVQQQVFLQPQPIQIQQQAPVPAEGTSPQNSAQGPEVQVQPRPIHFQRQVLEDTASQSNVLIQPQGHSQQRPIQFLQQDHTPALNNVFIQPQQLQLQHPNPLPAQYQQIQVSPVVVQPPQQPLVYLSQHQPIPVTNAIEAPVREEQHHHQPNLQHLQIIQSPETPPSNLLLSTPKIIPITQADAVGKNEVGKLDRPEERYPIFLQQPHPQSLTIPLINDNREEPRESFRVVPVRAKISLKNLIQSEKEKHSNDQSRYEKEKHTKDRSPQEAIFKSQRSRPTQRQNDIPERDSKAEASRTPIRQIAEFSRNNDDIAYMRPPPPYERQESRVLLPERTETIYGRQPHSNENDFLRPPSPPATTPSPFDFPPQRDDAIEIPGFSSSGSSRQSGYEAPRRPVVHKHIFVHSAPETHSYKEPRVRVIRPQMNPEKHMNIIFVRSPAPQSETQTVVELPPMEQPKTMVYVLSKKPNENDDVRVVGPPPMKPKAPEIYFIRYGDRVTNDLPVPNLQTLLDNSGSDYGSVVPAYGNQANAAPELAGRFKRSKGYGVNVYAPLMAYVTSGQINEITKEEAESRRTNMDDFF